MKRALWVFVIALVSYAVSYRVIEHRRASKGPWQVAFTREESGAPAILINQPVIGITNVQISFPVTSNTLAKDSVTISFGEARRTPFDLPLGKCVFLDTVFLPGTVVIEISGHQIQLLPRVLTLDGVEHPWHPGETFVLTTNANRR